MIVWPVITLSASSTTICAIAAAPAGDKLLDIAGLSIDVLGPVPVEQAATLAKPLPHGEESVLLGDEDFRIGGVGQKEPFERMTKAACLDFFDHRLKAAKTRAGASL